MVTVDSLDLRPGLGHLNATALGAQSSQLREEHFGWIAAWEFNPGWHIRALCIPATTSKHFGEAAVSAGTECGPCPHFIILPWHSPYK
jgi:hypothetical protein